MCADAVAFCLSGCAARCAHWVGGSSLHVPSGSRSLRCSVSSSACLQAAHHSSRAAPTPSRMETCGRTEAEAGLAPAAHAASWPTATNRQQLQGLAEDTLCLLVAMQQPCHRKPAVVGGMVFVASACWCVGCSGQSAMLGAGRSVHVFAYLLFGMLHCLLHSTMHQAVRGISLADYYASTHCPTRQPAAAAARWCW